MRALRFAHKGIAAELITTLVILFVVSFVWTIMSEAYVAHLFPFAEEDLANHTNASNTLDIIKQTWNLWPLVPIFGVIIWALVRAQRKEFDSGVQNPI